MKKERKTNRRPPPPLSAATTREWLGGIFSPPFFVTEKEPVRPEMVLWLELPESLIVGSAFHDPSEEVDFPASLSESMAKPMIGPPRRPDRVRVADPSLAETLRDRFPDLEVRVAPTPELDEVFSLMVEGMTEGGGSAPSYLEDGRLSAESIGSLFASARILYDIAPWRSAHDGQLIRLDIPALGVNGACLSIIGDGGVSFGFIIFPSYDGFKRFVEAHAAGRAEGPDFDLGTSTLALNFDFATDLPESMLRETREHGWSVAGKDAYPIVEHRERDGVPRPLVERDIAIVSACATSLASFFIKHAHEFKRDLPEPLCESWRGDDDMEVRFTAPYEAAEEFAVNRDDESRPAKQKRIGRNAPCPCGSGRKYKKCCLPKDRVTRESASSSYALHEMDQRLTVEISAYAMDKFGESFWNARKPFHDPGEAVALLTHWSLYHHPVGEETAARAFMAERAKSLSRADRSWLNAQFEAWLSIWEVAEVDPGRGLRLVDLLTGEVRDVVEVSCSEILAPRDAVLGRIVDHDGFSLICGLHPRALPPMDAADVVGRVHAYLRRKREVPVDRLRDPKVGRYLIKRWEEQVAELDRNRKRLPRMQNTDGDPLLLTVDHYSFASRERTKIIERILSIEQSELEPDGKAIVFFHRDRKPKQDQGQTVVGRVELGPGKLKLDCNSIARADALRDLVESACGKLIRHRAREHTDPIGSLLSGRSLEPGESIDPMLLKSAGGDLPNADELETLPELAEMVRKSKEAHYSDWMDTPIPLLDGKTPMECVRSRAGRERVELLLKDMENLEYRLPTEQRFDVSILRRKLGLDGE